MDTRKTMGATVLALVMLATAACTSGSKGLSVSARATGATGTTGATGATGATGGSGSTSLDGGNGILIDRIRVLVKKAEVSGGPCAPTTPTMPTTPSGMAMDESGHGGGSGDGGGGDGGGKESSDDSSDQGECEIEGGPFLVDLSGSDLTQGIHWIASLTVPAGTYEEIEFRIGPITAAQAGTDAGLAAMADAKASVVVDGTMDGTAFTFSAPLSATQKREGKLVIDATTGANVTLDVDPTGWFKASDGSKLSPTDPGATGAILDNIRASIRVLSDDDEDGVEDGGDGTHHG